MPTSQWHADAGVIDQLLAEPQRFEFFQAVRLLEQWRPGGVRFRNRLAMSFPPNQIENIGVDDSSVRVAPVFIGLLGSQGVLPSHYSERIARHERDRNDGAPRAFLDLLSHRPVQMFYQAWTRNRPECADEDYLAMLNALAGAHVGKNIIDRETLAYYAMQIRARTSSAPLMTGMYTEYFGVPVMVEQLVGEWKELPLADQAKLGFTNVDLDAGVMLGSRTYRCDGRARLRIGPLRPDQYERFLPGHASARQLCAMLELHCGVGMTWEVHLIQRAQDMRGAHLDANARLGVNARLLDGAAKQDHEELMYLLHS